MKREIHVDVDFFLITRCFPTKFWYALNSCSIFQLPIWTTTALLSIFPENVQADKTSTKISFTLPAKLPWTTQGLNFSSLLA